MKINAHITDDGVLARVMWLGCSLDAADIQTIGIIEHKLRTEWN